MTLVLGTFIGNYVVTPKEVSTDPEKLRSMVEWSVPSSTHRVRNFLGLATFCKKLIRGIRTLVAVIAGCCVKSVKEHPPDTKGISSEPSEILLAELPIKSVKDHPLDAKRILIEFSDGFLDEVPVPEPPWRGIGIDFILGLPEAQKSPPGMIHCNSQALFRGFLIWQIPWPWLETFV